MNAANPSTHCRVCGFDLGKPPWGADGRRATFEICPCCGSESGYEDCDPRSAARSRAKWLSRGAKWFRPNARPANWSLDDQLLRVPERFRD